MKYTNILEKIMCLFNIIKTSWVDISFLLVVVISIILLFRKKISARVCYIINVISSMILIGVVTYNNIDTLSKTFDSIVDYTFTNIYFPSIYVYLVILLTMNVCCILSLFKTRLEKKYKRINGIGMLVINFILALILDVVAKNKIDLFKKESMFSNTDLVMLLELSINIFLVWCFIHLVMFIADNITERVIIRRNNKVLNTGVVDMNALNVVVSEEEVKEEYMGIPSVAEEVENKFIPISALNLKVDDIDTDLNKFIPNIDNINNNISDNGFDLSCLIPKNNELNTITNNIVNNNLSSSYENNTNDLLNSILNNELPFIIKEEKNEKDTYTLNDYRIFNKMLKDIKEHNNSNRITIDKNLEYRLITKYSTEAYDMFKRMLKNYSN